MIRVEHLVFLHGWGGDQHLWQPLLDALCGSAGLTLQCIELPGFGVCSDKDWPQQAALLQQLYLQLPSNCILVGHSLGGMLATSLAALNGQEKILAVVSIAANACFVARERWPGMAPATFKDFFTAFDVDPVNTWEWFCALQAHGDPAMRALRKQLKASKPQINVAAWRAALQCLADLDNRDHLRCQKVSALYLFGERDALVPTEAVQAMRALGVCTKVIPDTGHLPHYSQADSVARHLLDFVDRLQQLAPKSEPFDKSAVARSFTRAAGSYDDCAHLQRAVCRHLLSQAGSDWAPRTILDLGSGTGFGTALLRQCFPQARIIALDLAEGMLQFAREQRPEADDYVTADAERLPLATGSIDVIFSSMALQWCYRLPELFTELQRVLAPGGRCLVATLGPATLRELKDSWAKVDGGVHVNQFVPAGQWHAAALQSGMQGEVSEELRLLHFDSLRQLMRELKGVGAHNINRAADRGMTGRSKLQHLAAAYEGKREAEGLPVTYEVIYMLLSSASR
ncbi:malonyl-ACP O-methyltransferase BioC [Microbulbifer sp. OS29]|uniref:Malonyl-[acyl-carrier protein] O-methyltransferase n=1 Tax=Microbulbifer okhotskensis TaxID=2926617 RepID=A0A9X2ELZ8_9GAMM|nr:malonyl-ACP O-methyltransferase BioC [Microbulbifer okhotskensis]MCO1334699.1 malonyl-ACP O-methyltransferase BioC [Microbulbifer okhotskensis]